MPKITKKGTTVNYSLQKRIRGLLHQKLSVWLDWCYGIVDCASCRNDWHKRARINGAEPRRSNGCSSRSLYTLAVGKPRVIAMKEVVQSLRPALKVTAFQQSFRPNEDEDRATRVGKSRVEVVFCGASNVEIDRALQGYAVKNNIRYASGVYRNLEVGAFSSVPPELRLETGPSPVWAGSGALSGVLALYSALVTQFNFFGGIPELKNMSQRKVAQILSGGGLTR